MCVCVSRLKCSMWSPLNWKVVVWFLLCFMCGVHGTFNFYMNTEEVKRILGTSKELYYVREGVVNSYALNFVVTIPAVITSLRFTWESLGQKPLPYTLSVESSDPVALQKPVVTLPASGVIPTVPTTFIVHLPCSGQKSTEVLVTLSLNVTGDPKFKPSEVVPVVLKRKKVCLEGQPDPPTPPPVNSKKSANKGVFLTGGNSSANNKQSSKVKVVNMPSQDFVGLMEGDEMDPSRVLQDTPPSTILFIILACCLGLILVLLAILTAAYLRSKKASVGSSTRAFLQHMDTSGKSSSSTGDNSSSGGGVIGGGTLFHIPRPESPHSHHYSTVSPCLDSGSYTYSTFFHHQEPPLSSGPHYSEISTLASSSSKTLKDITVQRCKVRLVSVTMEGSFAKLYRGTLQQSDGSESKVLIKTVSDHSSPVQMALLLHEGLALVGLCHPNVNSVIGVAAEERVPPFLIYVDDGSHNLKRYLQTCRSGPGRPITPQEIVWMGLQVASGLSYLHKQNVVHRDVATRNINVDDTFGVKLSDGGLSRDLFPEDYSWTGESETRPLRWSSPETLLQPRHSPASDTWAFGVTLWELATLAQTPFMEVDPGDLFSVLKMGYRLSQPPNCPDELFGIMSRCWTWDGDDRPKWTSLIPDLQSLHIQLDQYV